MAKAQKGGAETALQPASLGRIVHFFPNGGYNDESVLVARNRKKIAAAIITSVTDDTTVNLKVFIDGQPDITSYNVRHKSTAAVDDCEPYWDYPERVGPMAMDKESDQATEENK